MKLVNHQKENYTYDDTNSGSVMRGTIYMTPAEKALSITYLRRVYAISQKNCTTQVRDGLSHFFNWVLVHHSDKKRLCWGVTATGLIVQKYKLPRYKRQNYIIEVR